MMRILQKIKGFFVRRRGKQKNVSFEDIQKNILSFQKEGIVSIYSYPKYDYNTFVFIIDEDLLQQSVFEFVQRKEIKKILQGIPFLCLSSREIMEASDVFALQFFDIKTTATLLYGDDIFQRITISTKDLRRKMEFDIRNKTIYLRHESVRIPVYRLIENIVAELKPVMHAAEYLSISLVSDTVEKVEKITRDLQCKKKKYTAQELYTVLGEVNTMLVQWEDEVEKYEYTL